MFRTWRLRPSRSVITSVALVASRFIGSSATSAGAHPPAVDHHPALQPIEIVRVGDAEHLRLVHARDAVARMRQPRREVAVVHQQQQPFRFVVQPADRVDVLLDAAEQIEDRLPPLRVRRAS